MALWATRRARWVPTAVATGQDAMLLATHGGMHGRSVSGCTCHVEMQGCCERANKLVRDTVRTELMRAPTTW